MGTTRRELLLAAGCMGVVSMVAPARATPAAMKQAIAKATGGAPLREGRVKLEIAPLVENGHSVPLTVSVDSPMTPAEHVRAIHVFAEKNPLPNVISIFPGPRAGRARLETRIRLADTQTVIAVAELSDGSFWSQRADVIVTLAACLEELA